MSVQTSHWANRHAPPRAFSPALWRRWVRPLLLSALAASLFLLNACSGPRGTVEGVELSATSVVLPIGHSQTLTVLVTKVGSPNEELLWRSDDEGIATVEAGLITAVAVGETTVVVTSVANPAATASAAVVVVAPPIVDAPPIPGAEWAWIDSEPVVFGRHVTSDSVSYSLGDLRLNFLPHAADGSLAVAVDGILRIPADGALEIQGAGFAPESRVLFWFLTEPQLLGATMTDAAGAFEVNLPLPADDLGATFTPQATPGEHTVVIEGANEEGAPFEMQLGLLVVGPSNTAAVVAVNLTPLGPLELAVGEELQLQVQVSVLGNASQAVVWTTSDAAIATVDGTGLVTKVGPGSAIITATSVEDGAKSASVTVLTPAVLSVVVTPAGPLEMPIGGTESLAVAVTVLGDLAQTVTWSSSDDQIATVTQVGLVQKVALGTAIVTATSTEDASVSGSVEVFTSAVTGVAIAPTTVPPLGLGRSTTLVATVAALGSAPTTVTWTISQPTIAAVSDQGVVTGLAYGEAIITATSTFDPTKAASVAVLVEPFAHCPATNVWFVDAAAPPGGDGSRGTPFDTIAVAVGTAVAGEVVCLAPGVYPEPQLQLNKALSVVGPFVGVAGFDPLRGGLDASATVIGEAILANNVRLNGAGAHLDGVTIGAGGSLISAANLTVNHLRVMGAGDYPSHTVNSGLLFSSAGDNLHFEGNYVRGWRTGIFVQGSSNGVTFEGNRFEGNYTALSGDGSVTNLVYHGNAFVMNHRAISYATSASVPIVITDNTFANNTRGVMFRAASQTGAGLTFSGNRFIDMTGETEDAGNFGGIEGSVIFSFSESIAGTSLNGNWWGQSTGPKPAGGSFGGQVRFLTSDQAGELELISWCATVTCNP